MSSQSKRNVRRTVPPDQERRQLGKRIDYLAKTCLQGSADEQLVKLNELREAKRRWDEMPDRTWF